MPRFPNFSDRVQTVGNSVFESFTPVFRRLGKNVIPFHLGDTHLQPLFNLPVDKEFTDKFTYHNRYCNTYGVSAFRKVLADKVNSDNGFRVQSRNVLVTAGAVNALNAAVFALMNPDEEILVLTPCWPFFMGIVNIAAGRIKEVPLYPELYDQPEFDVAAYVQSHISPNTVAVYLNTPNNPSGKVLTLDQLKDIARVIRQNYLWLISDEAYESFTYDGLMHYSIANYEKVFEQTISIFSFAKMFMVAGYRVGYAVAEPQVLEMLNKILVHQIYNASSLIQYMMIDVVKSRNEWLPALKNRYENIRNLAFALLEAPTHKPEAGYYLFFSLKPYLNTINFQQLFEEILNAGVALTPGSSFGKDYHDYVRLCFTSVDEEKVKTGIALLNTILRKRKT